MKRLNFNKTLMIPMIALMLAGAVALPVAAQEQPPVAPEVPSENDLDAPGIGGMRGGFGLVCRTVTDTDIVAKALGISAAELRLALTSGKTVADLATAKNVTLQSIEDALTAQRKADVAQAVKDGLLTQAQADAMATMEANRPTRQGDVKHIRVPARNTINREDVAAKALGLSCVDLIKATLAGKSISQLATEKNVPVQTVIDAVVNAIKAATAADVKEGLITQAQADSHLVNLSNQVGQWVYSTRGMGEGRGGNKDGRGLPGMLPPGVPGQGRNPGQPGKPGAQPTVVPTVAATPAK